MIKANLSRDALVSDDGDLVGLESGLDDGDELGGLAPRRFVKETPCYKGQRLVHNF